MVLTNEHIHSIIYIIFAKNARKGMTLQPADSKFDVVINGEDNQRRPCAPRNNRSFIAGVYLTHTWMC